MADVSETIEDIAEGFDDAREELYPDGTVCYLLKKDGKTKNFLSNLKVTSGWYLHFNSYRFQFELNVATDSTEFRQAVEETSHIGIVVPESEGLVYAIDPNRREIDILPIFGEEPYWHIFCQHKANETFTPEEEAP